jgi:aryl-alcohol dehydrogenase-like predicted oxidoreductase
MPIAKTWSAASCARFAPHWSSRQRSAGGRSRKPVWLAKPRRDQFLALYRFLDEVAIPVAELSLRFALSNPDVHVVLSGAKTEREVDASLDAIEKGPLPPDVLARLDGIAAMVPQRPFEEPMCLPFGKPDEYYGPGPANTAPPYHS